MSQDNLAKFLQSISDYLYEEEANIDRRKIISIGTMLAVAAIFMATDAFAKHSSHGSHQSHSSSSHSSGHGNHSNHASHESHESHASHSSSNANHYSHSSSAHNSEATSHSNSGSASIGSGNNPSITEPSDDVIENGMIDIRVPLTPPDSPLMGGEHE